MTAIRMEDGTKRLLLECIDANPTIKGTLEQRLNTAGFNPDSLNSYFTGQMLRDLGLRTSYIATRNRIDNMRFSAIHLAILCENESLLDNLSADGFKLSGHDSDTPTPLIVALCHAMEVASGQNSNYDRNLLTRDPLVQKLLTEREYARQLSLRDVLVANEVCLGVDFENTPIKIYLDTCGDRLILGNNATLATLRWYSAYVGFEYLLDYTDLATTTDDIALNLLQGVVSHGSNSALIAALHKKNLTENGLLSLLEHAITENQHHAFNTALENTPNLLLSHFNPRILGVFEKVTQMHFHAQANRSAKLLLNKCDLSSFETDENVAILQVLRTNPMHEEAAIHLLDRNPELEVTESMRHLIVSEEARPNANNNRFLARLRTTLQLSTTTTPSSAGQIIQTNLTTINPYAAPQRVIEGRMSQFDNGTTEFFKKSYDKMWSDSKTAAQNVRHFFRDYARAIGHPKRHHKPLAKTFYRSLSDPNEEGESLLKKLYLLETELDKHLKKKGKSASDDDGSFQRRLIYCIKRICIDMKLDPMHYTIAFTG